MKYSIIFISFLFYFGCSNSTGIKKDNTFYYERELSFLHLRYGFNKENKWIKHPENILKLHETFKKFGYRNIFDEEVWNDDWNWYLDVSKSPKNLFDSLELTYMNSSKSPKYYQEFWERRKKEKNDETVIKVVKEINQIMNTDIVHVKVRNEIVNDTLLNLLSFEFPQREVIDEEANLLLKYLIKIGLHESAYNLINEEYLKYENVKWEVNKENILSQLIKVKTANQLDPWFNDNVK